MAQWKLGLNRTVSHLRRYRHIMAVLMKYGFVEVVESMRRRLTIRFGASAMPSRVRGDSDGRSRPQRVRLALEELGPTFIKLGQLLSTRPDLIPPEYAAELELLQDQVAPEKPQKIRAELEKELGRPVGEVFRQFDEAPLAAGSIAQVHRAVTVRGDRVAVKVRRPGVVPALKAECEILEDLAGLIDAQIADKTLEPKRLVQEFTKAVSKEVDLANEMRNIQRFARNFADDLSVHIPRVYEDCCTGGVLTMEYIEGIKPNNVEALRAAGLDPKEIASRGARFVLRQIFDFGFFHTDPHPGNLLILPGNVIAPLDFGQAARLGEADRQLLGDQVLAIAERDPARLVRAFQRADLLHDETEIGELSREIEELLELYPDLPLKDIPVGKLMGRMFDIIRRHHVRPPAEFTLMLKSMMTIESVGVTLDRDFRLIEQLEPFARRLSLERLDPRRAWQEARRTLRDAAELVAKLPEDLNVILGKFKKGQFQMHVQHEHLDNLVHTLDVSSNRLTFGLIIAGLLIASSNLVSQPGTLLSLIRLQTLGILGYFAAAVLGIWLLVSIIRSRHL